MNCYDTHSKGKEIIAVQMLPSSEQTASLLYVRLSKGQLPISIRLGKCWRLEK